MLTGSQRPLALDFVRLGRFVLLTFITTPPNYQWQQLLERAFPAYAPNAPERPDVEKGAMIGEVAQPVAKPRLNIRNTLTKWFVDCITLGALLNTVAFLVIMGMMKRQTAAQIADNIRTVCWLQAARCSCDTNLEFGRRRSQSLWPATRYGPWLLLSASLLFRLKGGLSFLASLGSYGGST